MIELPMPSEVENLDRVNEFFENRKPKVAQGEPDDDAETEFIVDPSPPKPSVDTSAQKFIYKMVQIAPRIVIDEKTPAGQHAAVYLEKIVNKFAVEGWEFFRVDTMMIDVQPGCLGVLFGAGSSSTSYHIATFRQRVR